MLLKSSFLAAAGAALLGAGLGRASGFSEPTAPPRIPDRLCSDRSSPWYNVVARAIRHSGLELTRTTPPSNRVAA